MGRWLLPCALLIGAWTGAARAQGVHAALTPASQTVSPGDEFNVDVTVTQAGSAFNSFQVVVAYDPLALTFLQATPVALQQGCLMTGACSAACGNTFHLFAAAGDSLQINNGLLCDQIALTGPGQVYRLHFKASMNPQSTTLSFRRGTFYHQGLFVTPLVLTGCSVTIGSTTAVDPLAGASAFGLRAQPNPSRGSVQLRIEADEPGELDLLVLDMLGRTVRRLPATVSSRGVASQVWDGKNESGGRAPAGIYLIQARLGDRVRRTRVALLW